MLAVKKIIAESDMLPTLILDEIDTGVSGKVAEEIGNLMREIVSGYAVDRYFSFSTSCCKRK